MNKTTALENGVDSLTEIATRAELCSRAWRRYAEHLEWCYLCCMGEDECSDGAALKEVALAREWPVPRPQAMKKGTS